MSKTLKDALEYRFGLVPDVPTELTDNQSLIQIANRGSCREFSERPVSLDVIRTLVAVAVSAPSKSDLQQRDVVLIEDAALKHELKALLDAQTWIEGAPELLLICANNRRQRQLHEHWDRPFVNDHLDAFFNAAVDAGILLSSLVTAAEAAGLGVCPISTIRNHADKVSNMLGLPDHVFVLAALAIGHPAKLPDISPRLPLAATVHTDRFDETEIVKRVQIYDERRAQRQTSTVQRRVRTFGEAVNYTWSDDKTRQYNASERADFGDHIRKKGFKLD